MPYTAPPQQWDHTAIVADTYQPAEARLVDEDGEPYSLAGVTGVAQVRAVPGGAVALTPTVTITDAADGRFTWAAAAASTASLQPGDYQYGVRLTWGDGTVRTVLFGVVRFQPSRVS